VKKILIAIGVLTLLLYGLWLYSNWKLDPKYYKEVYQRPQKIWSARGLYDQNTPQNSISSLKKAFKAGAPGAEIDCHYDPDLHRFILSHNHPKTAPDGRKIYPKKEGKILTLETLFNEVGAGHWFWLDFKNLGKLDEQETQDAIQRLNEITEHNGVKKRLYIEGTNPLKLRRYAQAGYHTLFDIQPLPETFHLTWPVLTAYKAAFVWGGFSAITMKYGHINRPVYGEKTQKILGDIPVFLYHIPDHNQTLNRLLCTPQVRVMLVGRDQSLNRFHLKGCPSSQGSSR